MEKLNEHDLEYVIGGLENHISNMSKEDALNILNSLSNDERTEIPNIRQPMTRDEFKKCWENSNNTPLVDNNNNL